MQDQSSSVLANCPNRCADSSLADMGDDGDNCFNRDLCFLTKAYDTPAGAITKRAGPKRWASGPSNACSLGYRDPNEASWSQFVDVAEAMLGSTELSVLADGAALVISIKRASRQINFVSAALTASRSRAVVFRR